MRMHRNRTLFRMVALTPFEFVYGAMSVYSGVAGLLGASPAMAIFNRVLPGWLVVVTNLLYAVSGMAILGGLARRLRDVEAFGLIMLMASASIRAVVLGMTVGVSPIANAFYVQALVLFLGISARLWVIQTGRAVLLAEPNRSDDVGEAIITSAH